VGHPPEAAERQFIEGPVLDRVRQGVPLDALLHAFRVGQSVFWDRIVAETDSDPAVAVALAGPSMRYIDVVCTVVSEVYLSEIQRQRADEARVSRDLLEAILEGGALGTAEFARAQALRLDGPTLVVIARHGDGRTASSGDALDAAFEAIAEAQLIGRLAVPRRGSLVVVLGLGEVEPAGVIRAIKERITDARCGISAPCSGLASIDRGAVEASRALQHAHPGKPIVAMSDEGAYRYLIASASSRAREMISPDLIRALADDGPDGEWLAASAEAFLDCDLSIAAAAERLIIHSNTLRYRLRQLEEKAGIDLKVFSDLVELRAALDLR
jgi:hypothetical protein